MTQFSYFWAGTTTGDAASAPYSDENFADFVQLFFSMYDNYDNPIIFHYDPVNYTNEPFDITQDTGSNMYVRLHEGILMFRGRVYYNDTETTLQVQDNNSSNPRIDTVVIEIDWLAKTIRTVIVEGTPAVSPSAPTLTQAEGLLYQYPLADIDVAVGETAITTAEITARTNRRYKRHEINRLVGEITAYGAATAPDGWLLCDGSEYDYSDERYSQLYAVIGSTYNTGGETAGHYRVPDLQGRVAMGSGAGAGLTSRSEGDQGGTETHQLTEAELAAHVHGIADSFSAAGSGTNVHITGTQTGVNTASTGGDTAHTNLQPYTVINYIIKY